MRGDLSERLFAAYYPALARRSDRAGQARTRERLLATRGGVQRSRSAPAAAPTCRGTRRRSPSWCSPTRTRTCWITSVRATRRRPRVARQRQRQSGGRRVPVAAVRRRQLRHGRRDLRAVFDRRCRGRAGGDRPRAESPTGGCCSWSTSAPPRAACSASVQDLVATPAPARRRRLPAQPRTEAAAARFAADGRVAGARRAAQRDADRAPDDHGRRGPLIRLARVGVARGRRRAARGRRACGPCGSRGRCRRR